MPPIYGNRQAIFNPNDNRTAFVTAPFVEGMVKGAMPVIFDSEAVGASCPAKRSMP